MKVGTSLQFPVRDPRLEAIYRQAVHDPREFLRQLLPLMARGALAGWGDDPEKRKLLLLRRQFHKPVRELRDACIFLCLLRQVLGVGLKVAPVKTQSHDADVFALWEDTRGGRFCPVQLKELPPGYMSKTASLDALLANLRKYPPTSRDTVVAVYLNRKGHLGEFTVPRGLNLAGLWLFGSLAPDASRWALIGDLLGDHDYRDLPLGLWDEPDATG